MGLIPPGSGGLARGARLALVWLVTPLPGGAQVAFGPEAEARWVVVSATARIDLEAIDRGADVTMEYVLAGAGGAPLPLHRPIDFELLTFGDASVDRFLVDGREAPVLWETFGSHRAAAIRAPDEATGPTLPLTLTYHVERAVSGTGGALHGRVPLLSGPSAPVGADASAFRVEVWLPDGWRAAEWFPSGVRSTAEGSWSGTLPVVPAVVSFRARDDGTRRPGLPLVIDLVTVLLFAGFALFGWRHLQGVARRARA